MSCSMTGIKAVAQIRVEQDLDLVLKNLKLKILGQPHDEVLLTRDKRYKHYKVNEDCIILKDGLLFRKYYGETGSIKYYRVLIPKQLVDEVLRNLHGEFGRHPGITETIMACWQEHLSPNMAQLTRKWVMSCEQDQGLTNREQDQHPTPAKPWRTHHEYAIQSDLFSELPQSGGYQNIVTAMDVSIRCVSRSCGEMEGCRY